MTARIELFEVEGRWGIADGGGWCAGIYDSEQTARYAHRMGADKMELMWADHATRHEPPLPVMTLGEVRAWYQQHRAQGVG